MALYDVSTTEKKAAPSLVAGGTLYADSPIGTILPYGGASAPSGWFLCDGTAVSRTTYAELFAVIGESFGAGDGSTTFNLPDMREVVPVGVGTSDRSDIATHDSYNVGEFKDDQLQNITGSMTNIQRKAGTNTGAFGNSTNITGTNEGGSASIGNNTVNFDASLIVRAGETTHGKQLGVNYIIKAKMVGVPIDLEQGVADSFNFQSGVTANQSMSAGGSASVSITLTNPMPDDEYTVDVKVSNAWNIATISNQTENGFTIMIQNTDKSASSPTTVSWQAFRIPH